MAGCTGWLRSHFCDWLTVTLERLGDNGVEAVLAPNFGGSIMHVTFDRSSPFFAGA